MLDQATKGVWSPTDIARPDRPTGTIAMPTGCPARPIAELRAATSEVRCVGPPGVRVRDEVGAPAVDGTAGAVTVTVEVAGGVVASSSLPPHAVIDTASTSVAAAAAP
ncbi:hypothetical protein GOAMR_33_01470 [Gordonia amarae NBRC 15530]|uniref:Uncharacterized protein n=1 Tax=Gordonia amarae NBRC 15530 TaxID=1075090 RepID=G7GNY4_9ACTN|nr:hypothetical protein GOAMR_33_01470 [Gordonia amarae NBRC 15530]